MDVETNGEDTTSNRPNENNTSGNETGFRKFRSFRIPVKVGEEYDVKIEAMSKRGDAGVAKIEGMVIFVANTKGFRKFRSFRIPVKVGEEYDVKIEAMSKRGDAGVAKIEGMVIFVANT